MTGNFLFLIVVILTLSISEAKLQHGNKIDGDLVSVGFVNRKEFFYSTQWMDKPSANIKCHENGMDLAYFDSRDEGNAVALLLPYRNDRFWTSAVGTYSLDNFIWQKTGEKIPNHPFTYFEHAKMGLVFINDASNYLTQTLQKPINNSTSLHKVLCTSFYDKNEKKNEIEYQRTAIGENEFVKNSLKANIMKVKDVRIDSDAKTPRLEFVGEYNGKYFYFEETLMDWVGAKNYCSQIGMDLVYFDSLDESRFIGRLLPYEYFWTSGYGTQSQTQFQWEATLEKVTGFGFAFFPETQTRLVYHPSPARLIHEVFTSKYYPLCVFTR